MSVVHDAAGPRWVPPERPGWVTAVNAEGRNLDPGGVVPLDPQSLITQAVRETGLEDFGDDGWREPFERLSRELDEDAGLNLLGRLLTRQDLLILLVARLRLEATFQAHPEIADEEILDPLVIVGQPRTGTSAMQELLAANPDNRTVLHWEAMYPCPLPGCADNDPDPRIQRADGVLSLWNRVVPTLPTMHDFSAFGPAETIHTQCLSFNSPVQFCAIYGQAHAYFQYASTQLDVTDAYRYEKRLLQYLQWKSPRKRWILKSPVILQHMPQVLDVYPDARFVWTHRDPVKALASVTSIVGTLQWMRSDEPFRGNTLAPYTSAELSAQLLSQPIEWLEDGRVPPERLCNVHFAAFVADPMAVVRNIYDYFGLELTHDGHAAMAKYLAGTPHGAKAAHAYDFGSDAEIALKREAFERYQSYFDVPSEI